MVDAIGELIVAIGDSVVNSDSLNEKTETKSRIIRALYYIMPISLLTGFYIWTIY
jgi:hypothetical protein